MISLAGPQTNCFNCVVATPYMYYNPDPRVLLLFLENDADLDRWFKIDDKFLKHELLDGIGPDSKAKRKPFVALDLKPLYGLRPEDVNYLAG